MNSSSEDQNLLGRLEQEFEQLTGLELDLGPEFLADAIGLCKYLVDEDLLPLEVRERRFLAHVNWKFRVNKDGLKQLYGRAAKLGYTFNYHQKTEIQRAFDGRQPELLRSVLDRCVADPGARATVAKEFSPEPPRKTLDVLTSECTAPSKLRRPKGDRNIRREILEAQFASFLFVSLPETRMHAYFDSDYDESDYRDSFWDELHARHPNLFRRDNALEVLRIDSSLSSPYESYQSFRDHVCSWVAGSYDRTNNYGFLAIVIEPFEMGARARSWELAADITLFAEKHREHKLDKTYFRSSQIAASTHEYIAELDVSSARFDLVNESWTYRDCFVCGADSDTAAAPERLLLLFQKNERDETAVPCPACRSHDVQGNSYPTLGVRSWECRNRLCPERSKYNRGKRYSFKALVMQQAIDDEHNEIPVASVRRWARDVQPSTSLEDVFDMLVRHYSLSGDTICVYNLPAEDQRLGRHVRCLPFDPQVPAKFFEQASWFRRYLFDRTPDESIVASRLGDDQFSVYCGDSFEVLFQELEPSSIDAAVTSPPYYNAREYAQWTNIYAYLYDMYNVARGVFRVLKPGACFLFNIFDYFDNERSVVFSAMGQRRMILSAYMVDSFRRIGFELLGNVVWDKGEIEGKRGFNAGNFSPYYQSPFNCWEHVLVFRKQGSNGHSVDYARSLPAILAAKPVIKMVRGQNTHGHTAPFPDALPRLVLQFIREGQCVLDPFGGSLTTGRVAEAHGFGSVQIERSREYCELGFAMRDAENMQPSKPTQAELPFST